MYVLSEGVCTLRKASISRQQTCLKSLCDFEEANLFDCLHVAIQMNISVLYGLWRAYVYCILKSISFVE